MEEELAFFKMGCARGSIGRYSGPVNYINYRKCRKINSATYNQFLPSSDLSAYLFSSNAKMADKSCCGQRQTPAMPDSPPMLCCKRL